MRFGLDVHCLLIFYELSQIFYFCDAQISSFSPLIPSNAPQAIGSDVDITTTVTNTLPTGGSVSALWGFSDETVGSVSINSAGGTSVSLNPGSIYASRIDISVGVFASDQFTTTLTVRELLASEDGSTVSITYIDLVNASLQLNVQECPSSLPYGVVITSSSRPYRYQASGMFSCPTGDLFYMNGTALPSSDTTCLANSEWSGQDNLQCWSAPTVMLNGDLRVIENNDITLTCDYDDTVIPSGISSIFYFDNVGYILKKEVAFTLQLQREDNGKPILCQAITPYTEIPIHNNTGRSLTETVNVLYAATQDDSIPTCNWNLNETGICSVVFFSNPNSQFVSLSKNGSSVESDGSMTIESTGDQGQQIFTFTRTQVINSDNGSYELTVKSSSSSLFSNSVLLFDIEVVDNTDGNGEPLGTSGLSTGAIAGIIAGVVVVILCAAGYGVYRWRSGSQNKNGNYPNELYPTGSRDHVVTDQLGYIDVTADDSTQINSDNQRKYEVVGPAEDENGYLAVNGSTTGHLRNRASNSQLGTDNAGYIVLNGEESNADSNNQGNASSSSRRYENIEGAYDDVISAPYTHTEKSSRRYENVEGPYDEINNS